MRCPVCGKNLSFVKQYIGIADHEIVEEFVEGGFMEGDILSDETTCVLSMRAECPDDHVFAATRFADVYFIGEQLEVSPQPVFPDWAVEYMLDQLERDPARWAHRGNWVPRGERPKWLPPEDYQVG
jgi:hypothetical protein